MKYVDELSLHLFHNFNRLLIRQGVDLAQVISFFSSTIVLSHFVHLVIVALKDALSSEATIKECHILLPNFNKVRAPSECYDDL